MENRAVKKAIVPVAGFGTRMLPATKAIPKEMLPVVDKPVIQYIVEECANAGINEIVMITHVSKGAIEDHFSRAEELSRPRGSDEGWASSLDAWSADCPRSRGEPGRLCG